MPRACFTQFFQILQNIYILFGNFKIKNHITTKFCTCPDMCIIWWWSAALCSIHKTYAIIHQVSICRWIFWVTPAISPYVWPSWLADVHLMNGYLPDGHVKWNIKIATVKIKSPIQKFFQSSQNTKYEVNVIVTQKGLNGKDRDWPRTISH